LLPTTSSIFDAAARPVVPMDSALDIFYLLFGQLIL
jgi:hypothetical protein